MMEAQEQRKYRATGRMVLRRIGKDQLLVPVSGAIARTNAVFPLNATGALIWQHITGGESVPETANALARAFDVSLEQARSDVTSFIQRLLDEQLLEATPS